MAKNSPKLSYCEITENAILKKEVMNAVIVLKHFLPQLNCENMSEYIQEKHLYPAIFVAKVSKGIPI